MANSRATAGGPSTVRTVGAGRRRPWAEHAGSRSPASNDSGESESGSATASDTQLAAQISSRRVIALDQVVALIVVAVVLIAVPGPSVLFVVSRGVALGRRAALATVIGNELGLLVQCTVVALGLGAIVERSIVAYTAIKLIGAAYLVYLGVQAFRHRHRLAAALDPGVEPVSSRKIVLEGLVVGVTNPKGFLIFAAVLPQFVDATGGPVPVQMFLLGLVCVGIAFVSDSAWALLAGTARVWFTRSPRRLQLVGGGSGIVMVGLGVRLALSGRRD